MRSILILALIATLGAPLQPQPDPIAKPQPLSSTTPPSTISVEGPLEHEEARKKEGATGDPEDDSDDDTDSPSAGDPDESDGVEFESASKRRFGVLRGRTNSGILTDSVTAASDDVLPDTPSVLDDELRKAVEQHIFNPMAASDSDSDSDSYSQKLSEATLRLDRRTLYSTLLEELSPNATSTSTTSRWVDVASTRSLAASVALTSAPGWRSHLDAGASYSDAFLSKRGIR